MSHMPLVSPVTTATTMVAMMVAMMLPSIAPTLRRHHRALAAARVPRAGWTTVLVGLGYVAVWTTISLALCALGTVRAGGMTARMGVGGPPWMAGVVVVCAGALQCTRWKARHLVRCRHVCVTEHAGPVSVVMAWRDGWRLGVHCALSCAAPTAILFVGGLMNPRTMAVIMAAITAERLAPSAARVARFSGTVALGAGLVMCGRAIELLR